MNMGFVTVDSFEWNISTGKVGEDDVQYNDWHIGDEFRVRGAVRWDTDRKGFYEIPPRN